MSAAPSWDVFLSYVTAEDAAPKLSWPVPGAWRMSDTTFPDLLKEQLHHLDPTLRCFVDKAELQQGDDWQAQLEEALRSSRLVVALITPGFALSKWATREITLADNRGIKILPINILPQGSEWPPRGLLALTRTQYVPFEAGPERVAQLIHKEIHKSSSPRAPVDESEAPILSQLMESVFSCQSRLSALADEELGFMHTFFHGRQAVGNDAAIMEAFDREYALLNTLFVLIEPFYYMARAKALEHAR